MAERLTEKCILRTGYYVCKNSECDYDCYNCRQVDKIFNKLGKLEDILEKYGVDIQNLDYILEDYSKNQGRDFAICEERDTLRQERDTWQKACELACEREDDCYVYDNIHRAYEFYQQAKKGR